MLVSLGPPAGTGAMEQALALHPLSPAKTSAYSRLEGVLESSFGNLYSPRRRRSDGAAFFVGVKGNNTGSNTARRNSALAASLSLSQSDSQGAAASSPRGAQSTTRGPLSWFSSSAGAKSANYRKRDSNWPSIVSSKDKQASDFVVEHGVPTPGENSYGVLSGRPFYNPKSPPIPPGIQVTDTHNNGVIQYMTRTPSAQYPRHPSSNPLSQPAQDSNQQRRQTPIIPNLPSLAVLQNGTQASVSRNLLNPDDSDADDAAMTAPLSPPSAHQSLHRHFYSPRCTSSATKEPLVSRARESYSEQAATCMMRPSSAPKRTWLVGMTRKRHRTISFSRRVDIVFFLKSEKVTAGATHGYFFQ